MGNKCDNECTKCDCCKPNTSSTPAPTPAATPAATPASIIGAQAASMPPQKETKLPDTKSTPSAKGGYVSPYLSNFGSLIKSNTNKCDYVDNSVINGVSLQECKNICNKTTKCTDVTYNSLKQTCVLNTQMSYNKLDTLTDYTFYTKRKAENVNHNSADIYSESYHAAINGCMFKNINKTNNSEYKHSVIYKNE